MIWTVAAAQMSVTDSIEDNLAKILVAMESACKKNANIICFPEIALISNEWQARRITREHGLIARKAQECGIHVIFGSYVLDDEKKVRNRIIVIDKFGTCIMKYNKRYLYRTESADVIAGKRNRIFTLDGIRCAVINCWDYAFPEYMRKLAAVGTDIIFCPSYLMSFPDTKEVLDKIPQVRAFDTMSYFVMVDAMTKETFCRSKICHPLHCLAEIQNKEGMMLAEINTEDIAKLREKYRNLSAVRQPVNGVSVDVGVGQEERS